MKLLRVGPAGAAYLRAGDVVAAEIEGLGRQRQVVASASEAAV
ncbi:hypothetical protein [Actinomadura darangshiensis]|nr:hypothetical protein [Actinomadura darangshiensis]